jgi:electron transport complex protein RnfG
MREIFKLAGILFVITAIAAVLLGFTNIATADKVAQQLEQENIDARMAALPIASEFKKVETPELENAIQTEFQIIEEVYEGISDNEVVGYTFKTVPKGYGGEIVLNVGISVDGKVTGIKVVNHSETPGLGAKATEDYFQDQYRDIPIDSPLEVVKTTPANENEIEAITGATVTTNGITDGVNISVDLYNELLK